MLSTGLNRHFSDLLSDPLGHAVYLKGGDETMTIEQLRQTDTDRLQKYLEMLHDPKYHTRETDKQAKQIYEVLAERAKMVETKDPDIIDTTKMEEGETDEKGEDISIASEPRETVRPEGKE